MGAKKTRGKLIVFEGVDGSGKATQTRLLIERLRLSGQNAVGFAFPQYGTFFGQMVGRMLRGEWGNPVTISPYLAYLPYAFDLRSVSERIKDFLERGFSVVSDRYPPTAGLMYQAIKLPRHEQSEYLQWQDKLMYLELVVPKPDSVFFLNVPLEMSQELILKKKRRDYLKGEKLDLLEKDFAHQRAVRVMGLKLCRENKAWQKIDCTLHGAILPPHAIHEKIWGIVIKSQKVNHHFSGET